MEKAIHNEDYCNYFITFRWMTKDLQLKGLKRDVFAIIYGFTQNGKAYDGGLEWIANFLDSDITRIQKILKELTEQNLLRKENIFKKTNIKTGKTYNAVGCVKYCTYISNVDFIDGKPVIRNLNENEKTLYIDSNVEIKTTNENTKIVSEQNNNNTIDKMSNDATIGKMSNVNNSTLDKKSIVTIGKMSNVTIGNLPNNNIVNNKFKNKVAVDNNENDKNSEKTTATSKIILLLKNIFNTTTLPFSDNFYSEILTQSQKVNLQESELESYLKWAYKYCKDHCNASSPENYFYKFAAKEYAFGKYKMQSKEIATQNEKNQTPTCICPVCGTRRSAYDFSDCPTCHLPNMKKNDEKEIKLYKNIFNMTEERKTAMNLKIKSLFEKIVLGHRFSDNERNLALYKEECNKVYSEFKVI